NGWNNVQRVNKQNQFVPSAVLTRTGIVNRVRPANVFYKTHSPSSRPFKKTTVLRTDFSKQKVNAAKDYPHKALKNKGIIDSGCSRHMTGNKAYHAEFQDFSGGPVAFRGSKGYITGKVCACSRFQVTPKSSHLSAVKRIFRYLKGKPKVSIDRQKDSTAEQIEGTDEQRKGTDDHTE
ncbi:hypothetical protein Tco_0292762, partial [Tanacetum coccineum]